MQIRNIRPFSQYEPGDVVDIPDGDAFDDFHWEAVPPGNCAAIVAEFAAPATPVTAPPPPDDDPPAELPSAPVQFPQPAPKEM